MFFKSYQEWNVYDNLHRENELKAIAWNINMWMQTEEWIDLVTVTCKVVSIDHGNGQSPACVFKQFNDEICFHCLGRGRRKNLNRKYAWFIWHQRAFTVQGNNAALKSNLISKLIGICLMNHDQKNLVNLIIDFYRKIMNLLTVNII